MKKIMLHTIKPERQNGPNSVISRIEASRVKDIYQIRRLVQSILPGKNLLRTYETIRDMVVQIKTFKPDIVHVTGLQYAGLCATLAAKIAGVECIIIGIHGFAGEALLINPIERWLYNHVVEPLTVQLSDYYYTVCRFSELNPILRSTLERKHLGTIYNTIPPKKLRSSSNRFRHDMDIGEDEIIIAVVGRIVFDKGHSYIIDAWKNNDFPNTKLLIIGEGPYTQMYKKELGPKIAERKIILSGPRNDVLDILPEVDIFLFATLHENLSMALLEALSEGCAIIATEVGGNSEIIVDKVNGLLIPARSSDSIVKAIELLITDNKLRTRLARNARKIDPAFSFTKFEENMIALYNKCIAGSL